MIIQDTEELNEQEGIFSYIWQTSMLKLCKQSGNCLKIISKYAYLLGYSEYVSKKCCVSIALDGIAFDNWNKFILFGVISKSWNTFLFLQESKDTWKAERKKLILAFKRLNTHIQAKKTEGSDFFVLNHYDILTRYEPPKNNNIDLDDTYNPDDSFMDVDDKDDDFVDIDDDETDHEVRVFELSFKLYFSKQHSLETT